VDIESVKELIAYLETTKAKRLRVKQEHFEVEIELQDNGVRRVVQNPALQDNPMEEELVEHRQSAAPFKTSKENEEESGAYITSPMVGTFYSAPSPDDPPYVNVGDTVKEGDVVCIIEAMKVMNEVKAEKSGTIKKVLVENGHPVEFGTKLFLI